MIGMRITIIIPQRIVTSAGKYVIATAGQVLMTIRTICIQVALPAMHHGEITGIVITLGTIITIPIAIE
jgi:hypothetical protein